VCEKRIGAITGRGENRLIAFALAHTLPTRVPASAQKKGKEDCLVIGNRCPEDTRPALASASAECALTRTVPRRRRG